MRLRSLARNRPCIHRSLLAVAAAAALVPTAHAAAQTSPVAGDTYTFTLDVPVTECDFAGAPAGGGPQQAPQGGKFYYVQPGASGTDVVIQFLYWSPTSPNYIRFNKDVPVAALDNSAQARAVRARAERKYFCVTQERFTTFARRAYDTGLSSAQFVVGALILPVKLRPATDETDFDFAKDLSVGTTAGWRVRVHDRRDVYVSAIGGAALSSVALTPENTAGTVTEVSDRAAFTWVLGGMFDVDRFQFGVFVGQDRISNSSAANWAHQGKTWYGLGLGYNLFGGAQPQPAAEQPGGTE